MRSNIAILYVCTGKYAMFWKTFYESAVTHLFPDYEKHFFVFTDDQDIHSTDNITVIYKQSQGFPSDSLYRYHFFLEIERSLMSYDVVYYFNANIQFTSVIRDEFLPSAENNQRIVAVTHAGYVNKCNLFLPYERSKDSAAYVPYKKNTQFGYYWGGINGGVTSDYLGMCKTISSWVDADNKIGKAAVFHDESYFNKYIHLAKSKIMPVSYGWPEGWSGCDDPKILILDKVRVDSRFRKQTKNIIPRIIGFFNRLTAGLIWRFGR